MDRKRKRSCSTEASTPSRGEGSGGGGPPEKKKVKEVPNFTPSGNLLGSSKREAAQSALLARVVPEPCDAARPTEEHRWRLFVFSGDKLVAGPYPLYPKSRYTFGRSAAVGVDIPLDHPSCSGAHAVVQHRRRKGSQSGLEVAPYLLDAGSTNGTTLNGDRLKSNVYVELRHKDVVRFGASPREYVILDECACRK